MAIYLASQSPRRHALLRQLGLDFQIVDVDVDETWHAGEPARDYVRRLAEDKAQVGLAAVKEPQTGPAVLGADTAVVLDGKVLGKAVTAEDARHMLSQLAGRCHQVMTAVALARPGNTLRSVVSVSQVHIRPLRPDEISRYCAGPEPLGKAGGYAIQGLAAVFIERLEGSYSGVVGLPLFETAALLRASI